MNKTFKKLISIMVIIAMLFSLSSNLLYTSADVVDDENHDFVHPVSASAKMRRPLYFGLDDRLETDDEGNKWHYFDPYNAAELLEITLNFSDGTTKTFGLNSQLHRAFSTYSLDLDFNAIYVNTAENPLKMGETYEVPFTYICNYKYPYTSHFDMMVEVEVADVAVTGLSATATQPIPSEMFYNGNSGYSPYLAKPEVAFTLSNGDKLPIDIKNRDKALELYGEWIYIESDQSEENIWQEGGNYKFDVYYGYYEDYKYKTEMPVTIESNGGIESVSAVSNEPIYEFVSGYYDDNSKEYQYSSLYYHDIDFTFKFKNGKTFEFNNATDEREAFSLSYEYDTKNWKSGNSYPIKIVDYCWDGNEWKNVEYGSFNMEFKPNPIESFTVRATAPAIYQDDGSWYTNEKGEEYFHYYDERFSLFYDIKFNDGRPDMLNAALCEIPFYVITHDQEADPFELGKNKAIAKIGDKTANYDVYVAEKYIKDIRVNEGVTIFDGMFAEIGYLPDAPYGEDTYYKYYPQFFTAKLDVELYDGTVITEYSTQSAVGNISIDCNNRYIWSGDKLEQNENNYWKVGDKFNLTLTVHTSQIYDDDSYVLTVPVTVKENTAPFELGWRYTTSNYNRGLGLTIQELKNVSEDNLKLVIPEEINGYPVLGVESLYCFGYMHGMLETVILPDSVINVSQNAFDSMRSMEYLYLGNAQSISQAHFNMAAAYDVEFSKDNKYYTAAEGVIYNKEMTEVVAITRMDDVSIAPTVKEFKNTLLAYTDYIYCDFTVTILGDDTRLTEIDNSTEYSEKTEFPFILCKKGSAAEADAKALGIEYATFSDIEPDDDSVDMPVTVTAHEDANIPDDARLSVKLESSTENQIVYDITIKSGNEAVQPAVPVTVTIDIPEGMQADRTRVYRLEEDGSKTNMKAVLKNGKLVFTTDHFSLYSVEEVIYTPGDINDDDTVNLTDVVILAQVVAGWDTAHNESATDVNGDGSVNLNDVVHLSQYTAQWQDIILH